MSLLYRGEVKDLNNETRQEAGGSFIQLPDGITHYEMGGPETGKSVILIHGFSVPYFIYDPTFEFLKQSGFAVLRYDLFGRGFSDRPHLQYKLDLFVKQLADLLDALHITEPASLIGLSMGGPIAAAFATHYSARVNKLVLIDPVGAKPIRLSTALKVAKVPVVGEIGFGLIGNEALARSVASDFFDPSLVEKLQSQYIIQMQYKGFKRAILSTIRNNMLGSFINVYERLGKMDKEILLLWGRNDATVPFEHSEILCAVLKNARFLAVDDCGHIPHYEKPAEINPILLEFLRDHVS
ncbi:MAG TPA: alpha/beta hydrolase [Anaerolineales bacterium]|nr:alpha/beta hydrolase [Anaerolineales bacterium]